MPFLFNRKDIRMKSDYFGRALIHLLLTAAAIYLNLVEILQLNFTMALLTVTSVFWLIAGIVIFLLSR